MSEYLSNETTHVPRDSVQFHLCGPSTRLIILREGKNGACWREGGKEDENVTGKSGHVYSREKQNAETGDRRLAPWCLRTWETMEDRMAGEEGRRKRKEFRQRAGI